MADIQLETKLVMVKLTGLTGYTIIDVDDEPPAYSEEAMSAVSEVIRVRLRGGAG